VLSDGPLFIPVPLTCFMRAFMPGATSGGR